MDGGLCDSMQNFLVNLSLCLPGVVQQERCRLCAYHNAMNSSVCPLLSATVHKHPIPQPDTTWREFDRCSGKGPKVAFQQSLWESVDAHAKTATSTAACMAHTVTVTVDMHGTAHLNGTPILLIGVAGVLGGV